MVSNPHPTQHKMCDPTLNTKVTAPWALVAAGLALNGISEVVGVFTAAGGVAAGARGVVVGVLRGDSTIEAGGFVYGPRGFQ